MGVPSYRGCDACIETLVVYCATPEKVPFR